MLGVEQETAVRNGHAVVALRGELDVTGAADAEAAITAARQPQLRRLLALNGMDDAFCVQASEAAAVAGTASCPKRYSWRRLAVSAARPGRAAPSRTGTG